MKFCAIELELADIDLFDRMSEVYPDLMGIQTIQRYFMQLAMAINYLHNEKNIAHNDIKLENIFLFKNQNCIKLADFGFARICTKQTAEAQRAQWKNRCVSLISPEILKLLRTQEVNESNLIDEKKSDVFAFGITLFSAVMLRSPFESDEASDKDMLYKYFYSGET